MLPASSKEFDASLAYVHGDAFAGFAFNYTNEDGSAPSSPLEKVVMQFRSSLLDESKASILQTISSDEVLQIEITDPATWTGEVKRQTLNRLGVGTHYWGMTFEDEDGNVDTLAQGQIQIKPKVVVPVS